jgi:hypothetical protein
MRPDHFVFEPARSDFEEAVVGQFHFERPFKPILVSRIISPESWPGLSRPSTRYLLMRGKKDVDAREDGVPTA